MIDDRQLLEKYLAGSREAITELVRRHVDLVYSSALRQVRDGHVAEDVTQAVFLTLAQKARSIRPGMPVAGWLMTVTRRTAVDAMRRQTLDRKHEAALARPEAVTEAAISQAPWTEIAPVLDAALDELPLQDRDAVVLRVLENQSLNGVGVALGISEDAARKRVGRGLEKLRQILSRRGVHAPMAVLAAVLTTEAVTPAPAHALTVTLHAIGGSSASASVAALVKSVQAATARTAFKISTLAGAAVLLLISIGLAVWAMRRSEPPTTGPAAAVASAPATNAAPAMSATFDTFQLPGGTTSTALALAHDSSGILYAAGSTTDSAGVVKTVVRRLSLGAAAWDTIFNANTISGQMSLTVDSNGALFVSRESGSATDVYVSLQPSVAAPTFALVNHSGDAYEAMAADNAGNVFQTGTIRVDSSKGTSTYWVVRKLTADGNATIVDKWNGGYVAQKNTVEAAFARQPAGISVAPDGNIYVVGSSALANTTNPNVEWSVRKSSDQGAHWSTVDTWAYDPTLPSGADAVVGDAHGNVYVLGTANSQQITGYKGKTPIYSNYTNWVVRQSLAGGSWTTLDNQVLAQGTAADSAVTRPRSLAIDAVGTLYAGGYIKDSSTSPYVGIIRAYSGGSWSQTTIADSLVSDLLVTSAGTLYAAGQQMTPHLWTVQVVNAGPTAAFAPLLSLSSADSVASGSTASANSLAATTDTGLASSQSADHGETTAILSTRFGKLVPSLVRSNFH